jgi:flagellar biosynthetic protein FliR
MELINYLTPINTVTFLLLFIRISSFLSFIPFFSYSTIPMKLKAAFSLWLTILLFPLVSKISFKINLANIFLAIMFEVSLAFFIGVVLNLIFDVLRYAAEQISFVMGFNLANVIDPNSRMNINIIGQFFTMIAILVFFTFNGDHLEILLLSKILKTLPLGGIFNIHSFYEFFDIYLFKYFLLGIGIAFPVLSVSLLSDIIFGMIMKTMPQFNLLVVGFPIKIVLSFFILIAILGSLMSLFSNEFIKIFNSILGIIG